MSRSYPCDFGECPYDASFGMTCRDMCGLGVVDIDEDIEDLEEYGEYEDYEEEYEEPSLWVQFLGERFGCHPDAVGNMPCDNGLVCDRCMHADAEFQQFKKGRE